jgi:putative phosphoesterase
MANNPSARIPLAASSDSAVIKIGVISDTHGHLDPAIPALFAGVDHILHGGDIGLPWLILELEAIAPVTAVLGNTDSGLEFKETEIIELNRRKFLVHHIVDVTHPADKIKRRIIRENPDVVVFGHTHKRHCEAVGQTLYFNPGYAGKQRFSLPRSVAILTCDATGITADYLHL